MYYIKIKSRNLLAGSKESQFSTEDYAQALEHYQRKCNWLGAESNEAPNQAQSFHIQSQSDDYTIDFIKTIVIDPPTLESVHDTIYICGPITNIVDGNKHLFNHVQKFYEKEGFRVINPHELCADIQGQPIEIWSKCMSRCINALCSDEVKIMVVLPGSENSRGANLEMQIADALKIKRVEWSTESETII